MDRTAKLVCLLLALGLMAASCGDDDDGDGSATEESSTTTTSVSPADGDPPDDSAETSTTSTEPVALTASWPGVTEDTIRLGFTTSDLLALKELGLIDLDRGDPQVIVDALIGDINERGGINGRMVEAHLEVLLPTDATAAEASCLRLTEDTEVFAVIGPFDGPNTEVNPCLNDLHATILVGGQPTEDHLDVSRAPWISNRMFSDRRLAGVVQMMEDEGLLGDTVGVVVLAAEEDAADNHVIPALEELGKSVIKVVQPAGTGDTATVVWETFLERFRVEEVDSVVLVENTATFGASQVVASDLDVAVLVVDTAELITTIGALGQIDPAELVGVIGSGAASAEETFALEATQDCVRAFEAANPDVDVVASNEVPEGGSDWFTNIERMCAPLRLFELAAIAAGPELNHDSFLMGAEGLGEIDLPGQVFASMGPGKIDAADAVRLMEFDPTVDEDGGSKPYGPLVRID